MQAFLKYIEGSEQWLWGAGVIVVVIAMLFALRSPLKKILAHVGYAWRPDSTWRRLLMELSGEGMVLVDRGGRIVDINQNACDLCEWTQADLIGKPVTIIASEGQRPEISAVLRHLIHVRSVSRQLLIQTKKREMVRTEWRWVPATKRLFYIILRDLRAPTRADAPSATSEEIAVLNRVSMTVNQRDDLQSVLERAIEECMKILSCDAGSIALIDPMTHRLSLAAQCGLPEERLKKAFASAVADATTLGTGNFKMGSIIFHRSLNRAPLPLMVLDLLQEEQIGSMITIPIVSRGTVVGQLDLCMRRPNMFCEVNTTMLSAIGEQIGMAIQNNKLVQEVTEKAIHLEHVLNSSPAAILVVSSTPNGEQHVTIVNKRFGELFGLDPEQLLDRPISELRAAWMSCFEDPKEVENSFNRLLNQPHLEDLGEVNVEQPKKGVLEHHTSPVRNDMKQIIGRIWVFTDITEQKAAAEAVRQAQKLESIGTLAAGIAHDFKNLLANISGNLSLAEEQVGPQHSAMRYLGLVNSATQTGVQMCQRLLAFGRKAPAKLLPVDLAKIVVEAGQLLKSSLHGDVTLNVQIEPGLSAVEADGTQMLQVLMNLAINAQDAMPNGGSITFSVSSRDIDEVACAGRPEAKPGKYVLIEVIDTGEGIPPKIMSKIFEPFFTTKPPGKGTGLGLSVVFGIVKTHGGWIQVDSRIGHGTTFQIFLPITDKVAVEPLTIAPSPAISRPALAQNIVSAPAAIPMTIQPAAPVDASPVPVCNEPSAPPVIMITDDDEMLLELTKTFLVRAGHEVVTATSGPECVAKFKECGDRVGLVILDMHMPEMSGEECLRELKRIRPSVKALFFTGYDAETAGPQAEAAGAIGLLTKPVQRAALVARVEEIIRSN